jgi:transglutaminase-like putative cysteine protease
MIVERTIPLEPLRGRATTPGARRDAPGSGITPGTDRVRINLQIDLAYEVAETGADFVFCLHPARTACQTVLDEQLYISQPTNARVQLDPQTDSRYLRLRALPGPLSLQYAATVDLQHHVAAPETLREVAVDNLPLEAVRYIYPSRYCESDRLANFAFGLFGQFTPGHRRVDAIKDWVQSHVRFESNTSDSATSACDTIASGRGVCRDFAHVMIALCRAMCIPARFATGTDYGADPALGPPDFHAYVEVFLSDRWYLFDPSGTAIPMGLVRIATGRDAADVAFATIFGSVKAMAPTIRTYAVEDSAQRFVLPQHVSFALSTDGDRHAP